jgi:hypothetical protein
MARLDKVVVAVVGLLEGSVAVVPVVDAGGAVVAMALAVGRASRCSC